MLIEGVVNGFSHFIELVKSFTEVDKERVLTVFAPLNEGWHSFKGMGCCDQIPCVTSLISELCGQAFHVPDAFQRCAHAVKASCRAGQRGHGLMPRLNGFFV